jgi:DNA repair photolyase
MPRPVSNPPNPWATTEVEWLEEPPPARLEVFEEEARSIVSTNDSPDLPFRFSANPYRGCQHGCAYCYARPSHQYLGFGAGTDFETRIVVKTNAAELLREELARARWRGRERLVLSGVTDCYQPLEASYRLTRAMLGVALEFRQPVTIITKSALVRRDLDLLAKLNARAGASVFLSIPFADAALCRRIEPATASPETRFQTLRALSAAGIPCGVSVSPLIPGLNDAEVPAVLARAAAAGATKAFLTLVRLPAEVEPVFLARLRDACPDRAERVVHAIEEARGGKRNESAFGRRMTGGGARFEAVLELFRIQARLLGLDVGAGVEPVGPSGRDAAPQPVQRELFP